jgi:hypothetical protein
MFNNKFQTIEQADFNDKRFPGLFETESLNEKSSQTKFQDIATKVKNNEKLTDQEENIIRDILFDKGTLGENRFPDGNSELTVVAGNYSSYNFRFAKDTEAQSTRENEFVVNKLDGIGLEVIDSKGNSATIKTDDQNYSELLDVLNNPKRDLSRAATKAIVNSITADSYSSLHERVIGGVNGVDGLFNISVQQEKERKKLAGERRVEIVRDGSGSFDRNRNEEEIGNEEEILRNFDKPVTISNSYSGTNDAERAKNENSKLRRTKSADGAYHSTENTSKVIGTEPAVDLRSTTTVEINNSGRGEEKPMENSSFKFNHVETSSSNTNNATAEIEASSTTSTRDTEVTKEDRATCIRIADNLDNSHWINKIIDKVNNNNADDKKPLTDDEEALKKIVTDIIINEKKDCKDSVTKFELIFNSINTSSNNRETVDARNAKVVAKKSYLTKLVLSAATKYNQSLENFNNKLPEQVRLSATTVPYNSQRWIGNRERS